MAYLKYNEQLRTGNVFTAEDSNNNKSRYKYIGVNLRALKAGDACLMVQNLVSGEQLDVSIQWFEERTITVIH